MAKGRVEKKSAGKWTKHFICGVDFCMLTTNVPAGYTARLGLGDPSRQTGDELVVYAYKEGRT